MNCKNKKGFTIIEVVLVLAISGLIFLMVFIALPALQRGQRNTRRRHDMSRFVATFIDYKANTGHLPTTSSELDDLVGKYIGANDGSKFQTRNDSSCVGDAFCDPDGSPYNIGYYKAGELEPERLQEGSNGYIESDFGEHVIAYFTNAKCNGENSAYSPGAEDFTLMYVLEGGSVYCGDNQ